MLPGAYKTEFESFDMNVLLASLHRRNEIAINLAPPSNIINSPPPPLPHIVQSYSLFSHSPKLYRNYSSFYTHIFMLLSLK